MRNNLTRGKLHLDIPNHKILSRNYCSWIQRGINLAIKKRKNFCSKIKFMSKSSQHGIAFMMLKNDLRNQETNVQRVSMKRSYSLRKDNNNPLTCAKHVFATNKGQ